MSFKLNIYKNPIRTFNKDLKEAATTIDNKFIPYYSICKNNLYTEFTPIAEKIKDDIYLYYKPSKEKGTYYNKSSFVDIIEKIETTLTVCQHKMGKKKSPYEKDYFISISLGYIADPKGEMLLLLCTKSFNPENYEDLQLFVSNSFKKIEPLKGFYKKLMETYIEPLKDRNVNIFYTKDIESQVFYNNIVYPYKDVKGMQKHLNESLNKLFWESEMWLTP